MQLTKLVPTLALMAVAPIPADFESIKKEIQSFEQENPGRTLTIPSILERLPGEFRSSFSLMYQSHSLQSASFTAPRVIMFGNNARTVMTFNGDPQQSNHSRLEFASVDPSSHEIVFQAIDFPQGDSGEGQAVFSERNPPLCMACHGSKPHYIWAQYAQWPGAYGSRDDVLELTNPEKTAFQEFLQTAASHERYRFLLFPFSSLSAVAPYRPLQEGRPGENRGDYQVAIEFRPNFRLGALLMRHQTRARAAAIAQSEKFASHRYGFIFHLAGCSDKFQAPQGSSLQQATGFKNLAEYASIFQQIPSQDWHLEKGPEAPQKYDYSPGLNSFRSSLLGHLWPHAFNDEALFKPYWKPILIADYVRSFDKIGFKVSEEGQAMWETLDFEGPIPSGVAGTIEADNYGKLSQTPMLTQREALEMCRYLAERQLSFL